MKQFSFKIVTITLSFLVLFSTFSFTVDTHYCGDFLMDVSILGESDGCGMQMDKQVLAKKKNCCKDEVHKVEGQDELQVQKVEQISFENQQFLAFFVVSYQDLFLIDESKTTFYKDFSPPDIPRNYQVLYQSFLI
jgi:hypothetical protein